MGALIAVAKLVRSDDGDVKLCSMSKLIRKMFEICALIPKEFELFNSASEAIDSFDQPANS